MLLFIIIWKLILFNKNIYLIIYSSFFHCGTNLTFIWLIFSALLKLTYNIVKLFN